MAVSRRSVLAGMTAIMPAVALGLSPGIARDAPRGPVKRIAILTRWIAETALNSGIVPIALAELSNTKLLWRSLGIPENTIDLGLAAQPNLELLAQLELDCIILDSQLQGHLISRFDGVAPVVPMEIYTPARTPLELARKETQRLGDIAGGSAGAAQLIEETDSAVRNARQLLIGGPQAPVFVARLLDDRNVTLYCGGSIFHDVLIAAGIVPAATVANNWGFLTTGIETLASVPDARIVYFEPVPKEAERLFSQPSLWSHLPSVQKGLTTAIPEFYSWGALPTAKQFAETLTERLPRESAG
jgi:ABC-type Fe3+-hydroxamate transport system substrate-binding protein